MIQHIEKPAKRTFWKISEGDIVHKGYTDINQITSTGLETVEQSQDPSTIYPALPESGLLLEGANYSWGGKLVQVRQEHERTIYNPTETPALFTIVRPNNDGTWIEQEEVEVGDERTYDGKTYKCIQSHMTLSNWQPPNVPALWEEIEEEVEEDVLDWVQPTGGHDAYNIGDQVLFNGNVYESVINANVWSPTTYPQGWNKI